MFAVARILYLLRNTEHGILLWRYAGILFKEIGEIVHTGKSKLIGDLGDSEVCVKQKPLGLVDFQL